jgi:hypothetical protein
MTHRFSTAAIAAALLAATLAPAAAAGQGSDDCGAWFPDFRCDREARFEGFAPPMTSPYLFEDPFITTELGGWAIWNEFPGRSVFRGGDLRAAALQVRVALTDRIGLLATRDGYIKLRPDRNLLDSENGWADLGIGVKYALFRSEERRMIVSPWLRYDLTQGTNEVFQGHGEGAWNAGVSAGMGLGEAHLLTNVGAHLPVDGDKNSTYLFYNLHVGLPVTKRLVPFVALNGLHYVDDGDGSLLVKLGNGTRVPLSAVQALLGTGSFEGLDLANLGSDGIDGHDFVSLAGGVRFLVAPRVWLGLVYERPLTQKRDLMKQRVAMSLVLGF